MKLLNSELASTSGTGSTVWTYVGNESPNEIEFANDSSGDAVLTIDKWSFTIKSGESFATQTPESFTEIDIVIDGDYRMLVGS